MATTADIPRLEMLQVADMVAREKGIEREEVLEAMEQAIQKAGRSKYGQEYDIRAEIDRRNGEIRLLRFREVVETVENEATQMPLAEKRKYADFVIDTSGDKQDTLRQTRTVYETLRFGSVTE